MIHSIRILSLASALVLTSMPASAAEEAVTLVSNDSKTNSLSLEKGESATLAFVQAGNQISGTSPINGPSSGGVLFWVTLGDVSYRVWPDLKENMVIAGPAVLTMTDRPTSEGAIYRNLATFKVTRVGTANARLQAIYGGEASLAFSQEGENVVAKLVLQANAPKRNAATH